MNGLIDRMDRDGVIFKGMVIVALVLLMVTAAAGHGRPAEAAVKHFRGARYESVKLTRGDTLETIADRYNDRTRYSDEIYVSELMSLNRMDDEALRPGCYLSVICFR